MSALDARVVFDGSILGAGPPTGVAGSFLLTLAAFCARAARPPFLVVPPGFVAPAIAGLELVHADLRGLRRWRIAPRLVRELGAGLWHAPIAALPPRCPCPMVATVHDLPWRAPVRLVEPGVGWRHRLALRLAMRTATRVLVPSRSTATDLGDASHVRVVPHGIETPSAPAPESALVGAFLAIGDERARKNLDRLRAAHTMARTMDQELPDLRVIGPRSGWVAEAEKLRLLRSARALVHVSLFEGFGLPVLEAMAHGVPVVASRHRALPELAGDAALYVDPLDVPAIAQALVRVHRDTEERTRLCAAGPRRAREFTPERSAELWRRVHAEALDGGGPR